MLLTDFYTIAALQHTEGTVAATATLNAAHPILEGHFPENPVVPGVCLMTMVKEVLVQATGNPLILVEAKSVKFLGIVNPNINTHLQVNITYTLPENGSYKTTATITAGETVCYKASAVYARVPHS